MPQKKHELDEIVAKLSAIGPQMGGIDHDSLGLRAPSGQGDEDGLENAKPAPADETDDRCIRQFEVRD